MLSDAKGNYGCLGKGHECDEVGNSYDELFRYDQRHDRLWDGSQQNVRRELGFFNYDQQPTEEEMIRRSLASTPADLAYSNYHRQSELGALLKTRSPPPQWNALSGIDRYWTESNVHLIVQQENNSIEPIIFPKGKHGEANGIFME